MRLNRFFNASKISSGMKVDSEDGDIATYPISYKLITSFKDFVMNRISPFAGNCSNPCTSVAVKLFLHLVYLSPNGRYILKLLNTL